MNAIKDVRIIYKSFYSLILLKMTNTYTNVQDWLNSNPSEETINKVLDLVNRNIKKSMRLEIFEKSKVINKMHKTMNEMEKYGVDVPKNFKSKIDDLEFEIESMKQEIEGVSKPKKEKKKKEVAVD